MNTPIRRARIQVASTRCLFWTEVTPDERPEDMMTPVRHDTAVLRVSVETRFAIPAITIIRRENSP